ncbi:MAG: DUF1775 domain-containing protein [Actinobacteria bacterium]|nr:DUF1775 domain-containing protein [Actinomycetota bacterium]
MEPLCRPIRRTLACLAAGAFAVVVAPSAASAHIEGTEVEAGSTATVPFHVEHGCDGEPTTKVEIKIPDEVTEARPVGVDGWEGTVDGQVVTFANGSQPADEEIEFPVTFKAPSTPMTLLFPIIQTCGDIEVAWTGEDESDEHPAAVVEVVAAEGGGDTTTEPGATATTEAASTTTVDEGATTTTTTVAATDASSSDDDDDSSPLVPILIGVAAIVVIGGGAYAYGKSKKGDGSPDAGDAADDTEA